MAQVKQGKMVYIAEKWRLIDDISFLVGTLQFKKINDKKANDKQLTSTLSLPLGYHVSREGAAVVPYYLTYIRLEPQFLSKARFIVTAIVESGIYNQWTNEMARYSLGIIDDNKHKRGTNQLKNSMEFNQFTLSQLESLFDNIWKALIISGIMLIWEMIAYLD